MVRSHNDMGLGCNETAVGQNEIVIGHNKITQKSFHLKTFIPTCILVHYFSLAKACFSVVSLVAK
jgi:hypothetical protein